MELRQLERFLVLAEELNFTRAADKLHAVQSALTTSIQDLELELRVPPLLPASTPHARSLRGRRALAAKWRQAFLPAAFRPAL